MANYPIKLLKDESGTPFVPLTTTTALYLENGETLDDKFATKLEASNIKAGKDITVSINGNDVTINNASKGVLIDNLTTTESGKGSLDAHQGKVLKDLIPEVINNLTTIDSTKALSAHQGYILAGRSVPSGGAAGQVLKKSADDNYSLEWGDAADPNAIIGDGSIKKIVYLTIAEYNSLATIDPDIEYHIQEVNSNLSYIDKATIQEMIASAILDDKKKNYPVGKIEINVSGANPSTYLGFGTWIAWGTGRVPVGINTSDTDFNTVEKTGGSKTHAHTTGNHTLTVAEIPSHNHMGRTYSHNWDGGVTIPSGRAYANTYSGSGNGWAFSQSTLGQSEINEMVETGSVGGSGAHNHGDTGSSSTVQPYITCYMWKRTA